MLEYIPVYVSIIFILTTAATLIFFFSMLKKSTLHSVQQNAVKIILGLTVWLLLQATFTLGNIYSSNTYSFPPKILLLGIWPALFVIIALFVTQKGRQFIDSLPVKHLTYLHSVRIPVELVLFWLYIYNAVPELMTFEGRNFDILAGITAPLIAYFGFKKRKTKPQFHFDLEYYLPCIADKHCSKRCLSPALFRTAICF